MNQIKVRINGRGNAWPIILGQEHSFYDRSNYEDLANASCSIIKSVEPKPTKDQIEWELMIDAGHGAVQYLLKNCNRIPEALFLTHPHIDHTLGLDWIVQSYFKTINKRYPVYTTRPCWERIKVTFPHLIDMVEFNELIPYNKIAVKELKEVNIISYPVYHGPNAVGASMFLFEITDNEKQRKILFTGDILCPILRKQDYAQLFNLDLIVADANNRYPYPKSNHWSILKGYNDQPSEIYGQFLQGITIGTLLYPHINNQKSDIYCRCFDYFFNQEIRIHDFYFTIKDFIHQVQPQNVCLIHYSGIEDEKYYQEKILSDTELGSWGNKVLSLDTCKSKLIVPYVSQHINFSTD